MGRRLRSLALVTALLVTAAPAGAESQWLNGEGPILQMHTRNGEKAVVVKIYGPGKGCDDAR